jgi:hypothetical protein
MSTPPLTSWKEIAHHLNKSVRTVQRWEQELGLPIRRPEKNDFASVLAFPEELDLWLHQHTVARQVQDLRDVVQSLSAGQPNIAERLSHLQNHYELNRQMRERAHTLLRQTETLLASVNHQMQRLQATVQKSQRLQAELGGGLKRRGGSNGAAPRPTRIAS